MIHGKIVNLINELYSNYGIFLILPIFSAGFMIIQVAKATNKYSVYVYTNSNVLNFRFLI
jgi:hypothetical protein